MKRRILWVLAVLVALYATYRLTEGTIKDWYADNYMVRTTTDPATPAPDHVRLTWNADPRASVAVQWRTADSVSEGWVEFREKGQPDTANLRVRAEREVVDDRLVQNDPVNHLFAASLTGLKPGTEYVYRVGHDTAWSEWSEFTTAPDKPAPFSFIYVGDIQTGFEEWGGLLRQALERRPDAAFCVIPGDLVNNGDYRDQWDAFFDAGEGVFNRLAIVPALGNHDYAKEKVPENYLELLVLPENGPKGLPPERAYSFTYANTLFVVLDSNRAIEEQTPWLEDQLEQSTATWKIAVFHHPAYSSAPHRNNKEVRKLWMPLFDRYGVDLALQGHDHAYLRTYPMKAGRRADKGVVYAVTVGGSKYYEQDSHDYAEVEFPNVSTCQIIDVAVNPDRLTYRAYDAEGKVRDELILQK